MPSERDQGQEEKVIDEIIQELEDLLERGEEYKIHDIPNSDINSLQNSPQELYKTVEEDLTRDFGEEIKAWILQTLVTKNLGPFAEKFSDELEDFLSDLIRRYGTPIRHGHQKLFETDDWRYVTTSLRDNVRGVRLVSEVLKWSGEKVVFGGTLPSMLDFAQHIVKNVSRKCDSNQLEEYRDEASEKLDLLKSEIQKLEEVLEKE